MGQKFLLGLVGWIDVPTAMRKRRHKVRGMGAGPDAMTTLGTWEKLGGRGEIPHGRWMPGGGELGRENGETGDGSVSGKAFMRVSLARVRIIPMTRVWYKVFCSFYGCGWLLGLHHSGLRTVQVCRGN